MQYLKQIKGKALAISIFENKLAKKRSEQQQKQKQAQKPTSQQPPKQSIGYLNSVNIKAIAKSWFHKGKDNEDKNQSNRQQKQPNVQYIQVEGQKRFWQTSAKPTTSQNKQQQQINSKQSQAAYQTNPQQAIQFISNLCSHMNDCVKQRSRRITRAKNKIFGNLQMQPIYMSQNIQVKILKMQMQASPTDLLQRTQSLVIEKDSVDRAIENALVSGYLWQANEQPNRNIIDACYETVSKGSSSVFQLSIRTKQVRKSLQLFLNYFNKVNKLNQKRVILVKKIKLLQKIKTYKKDACQSFQNIDQAFYIERNRQKIHSHFIVNQKLVQRVLLIQNLLKIVQRQNSKVIALIQKQLKKWIDSDEKYEKKHIQKMFILLYFIRNQPMYVRNGLNISLDRIKNKQKLISEIGEVKKWEDYKYVNDKYIKIKVSSFLDKLIKQLESTEKVKDKDQVKAKIRIKVTNQLKEKVMSFKQ